MDRSVNPFGVDTTDVLYAKLRSVLLDFGIRDFSVYSLEDEEARLAFLSGAAAPLRSAADGRVLADDFPTLWEQLRRDRSPLTLTRSARGGGKLVQELDGASAVIRLAVGRRPVGFIVIHGELTGPLARGQQADELQSLSALFSAIFASNRANERLQRDHRRTVSKLQELQKGLEVLVAGDQQQIMSKVLDRALHVLGARSGMIWLKSQEGPACLRGEPPPEGSDEVERVVERCYETHKVNLVSSLSDEVIDEFDVDTIHIASVVGFPLRVRSETMGCLLVFDATVSMDTADIVEGAALVGATALESRQNAERMVEQQKLAEQMALAAEIQQRLLPARRAQTRGMSVAHFSQYCDQAGGDYVDTIPSAEPYLCSFVVGDVAGHGLGSAMLMVDVRARLRTILETHALWSPEMVLDRINKDLCRESAPQDFVTLVLCSVDTRTGELRYASAGHEPPIIYRARERTWDSLPSTGLPLGMEADATYTVESATLELGDLIVFATDGAVEALNSEGEGFGVDGIQTVVEQYGGEGPEDLVNHLVERTREHCGDRPFTDDVTYLVVNIDHVTLRTSDDVPSERDARPVHSERFVATRAAKDKQLAAVRKILDKCIDPHDSNDIMIALDEGLTNAVIHGNREDKGAKLNLKLWCTEEAVEVFLEHEGQTFDPRQCVLKHIDESALQNETGRGILIMASIMDDVVYWNQGRGLHLSWRRQSSHS